MISTGFDLSIAIAAPLRLLGADPLRTRWAYGCWRDASGHLPGARRGPGRREARARADGARRRDRPGRGERHLRLGPPHLPRARADRPRLHRSATSTWATVVAVGDEVDGGRRGRPRAGLLLHRLRRLLLLRARRLPQVRRRPASSATARLLGSLQGAQAELVLVPTRRPDPAQGARGALGRRRPVRRRRDGHRLPRDRCPRRSARATSPRCSGSGPSASARCRWRWRPGAERVIAIDTVDERLSLAESFGATRGPPDRAGPARGGQGGDRGAGRGPRGRRGRPPRRARPGLPPGAQGRDRLGHRRLRRADRAAHGDRLDQGADPAQRARERDQARRPGAGDARRRPPRPRAARHPPHEARRGSRGLRASTTSARR